jgi:hypothetical protein
MEAEMVVINKFLKCFLVFLFLINFVYAGELLEVFEIKDLYSEGDVFVAGALIGNIFEYSVRVDVEYLLFNEKGDFPLAISPLSFFLGSGEEKEMEMYNFLIDEDVPTGNYNLHVRVLFDGREVDKKLIEFDVISVGDFSFDLNYCKTKSCSKNNKVFIEDEIVYLDYISSVSDPDFDVKLTYPDGFVKALDLPFSFRASSSGNYELNIVASKAGYKTIVKKEQFGVIEEEPDIKTVSFFGEGSIDENISINYLAYWIIGTMVFLLLFFVFIIWILNKKTLFKKCSLNLDVAK